MGSVKSVSSVRERNTLCERRNFPATLMGLISTRGCILFLTDLHRRTEHTKARKIAAPPPTPPPKGRGVITEIPMLGGCRLLFASLLVSTIAETLCVLCMPKAFCGLEMCAKRLSELCALCERKNLPRLREKPPQRVVCVSSHRVGMFYFSQKNTDEQNTQRLTETLSQPISQNLTANVS